MSRLVRSLSLRRLRVGVVEGLKLILKRYEEMLMEGMKMGILTDP